MKFHFLYIAAWVVLASMMACQQDMPDMKPSDKEASRIYLSAGIGESVSSTRAPYYPTDENGTALSQPTVSHPLNVSVWASTTSGTYPNSSLNGSSGTVAIHTEAHFHSGEPQLLGHAIYPKKPEDGANPSPVYFIGLHPMSKEGSVWTAFNDNKSASYTFTGKEDVMFAPQISGIYGIAYDNSPTFHFYHLLTLLRIKMVADREETDVKKKETVAQAWGKVKELTITSQDKVVVELSNQVNATFSNQTDVMPFYQTGSDEVFPVSDGYAIPTKETEVAYVMCAPVEAAYTHTEEGKDVLKPEYYLHLKTEKRSVDIPIDLKSDSGSEESSYFTGSTMGKEFSLLLNFKMGNVISVSAAISLDGTSDWYTHGTGSVELDEEDLVSE